MYVHACRYVYIYMYTYIHAYVYIYMYTLVYVIPASPSHWHPRPQGRARRFEYFGHGLLRLGLMYGLLSFLFLFCVFLREEGKLKFEWLELTKLHGCSGVYGGIGI